MNNSKADNLVAPEDMSPKALHQYLISLELSPDKKILEQAILLASDRNVRISKLSESVLKDPITTLEILKAANSGEFSTEKSSIAAVQTAVIRIGSKELVRLFEELKNREDDKLDSDVLMELNSLRRLSERASIVAEIFASNIQKDISEISQTCGLLSYVGQMILCCHLKREYLELAHLRKRNALAYRLQSRFNINFQNMQLDYFRSRHLPPVIFYAFDRELKCKTPAQSSLRFIIESAVELVEAYEDGKWSKYTNPGKLPPKSNIRLLKISDQQYTQIVEEIEDSLGFSQPNLAIPIPEDDTLRSKSLTAPDSYLSDDTEIPISGIESGKLLSESTTTDNLNSREDSHPVDFETEARFFSQRDPTVVIDRSELISFLSSSGATVFIEKPSEVVEQEKQELSVDGQAVFELLESICKEASESMDLLRNLMEVITEQGPFSRAALIELTDTRKQAIVHTAIGESFETLESPHALSIMDPLSPLSLGATKVQSFNAKSVRDFVSPFGISSYAISPLKLNGGENPLVFYADCGEHKPLPFEARKTFRLVIALLNQTLPRLTQNIPPIVNQ
ncbi:MAG TPA: HDOD domain-containing protein [Oligoflexia bacterium]|nr:HDOD domain-containing protein [Oligoflexia bacterium]HMP47296.1 HDOD domain-containing protein [Oligoflexia bacterium]